MVIVPISPSVNNKGKGAMMPLPNNPVFNTAMSYVAAGLSVIPIRSDGSKAPCAHLLPRDNVGGQGSGSPSWKIYQRRSLLWTNWLTGTGLQAFCLGSRSSAGEFLAALR